MFHITQRLMEMSEDEAWNCHMDFTDIGEDDFNNSQISIELNMLMMDISYIICYSPYNQHSLSAQQRQLFCFRKTLMIPPTFVLIPSDAKYPSDIQVPSDIKSLVFS